MIIETFDGETYFVSEENYPHLKKALTLGGLVELNGELVHAKTVKRVYPDDHGVAVLTNHQRLDLLRRKKRYHERLGVTPPDAAVQIMINKILANEQMS